MASFTASEHVRQDTVSQDTHVRQLAQRVAETGEPKELRSYLDAGGQVDDCVEISDGEETVDVPLLHALIKVYETGTSAAESVKLLLSAGAEVDAVCASMTWAMRAQL
jgi:hypothetical protein